MPMDSNAKANSIEELPENERMNLGCDFAGKSCDIFLHPSRVYKSMVSFLWLRLPAVVCSLEGCNKTCQVDTSTASLIRTQGGLTNLQNCQTLTKSESTIWLSDSYVCLMYGKRPVSVHFIILPTFQGVVQARKNRLCPPLHSKSKTVTVLCSLTDSAENSRHRQRLGVLDPVM